MGQGENYKSAFRKYFSDFYRWNAVVFVLFIVTYACYLAWGGEWGRYWITPLCFLLIALSVFRYYRLFFTAVRDLNNSNVESQVVQVDTVYRDGRFNFYNRGGGMVGEEKCVIADTEGNIYRVVIGGDGMIETESFEETRVEITYLKNSRIVLHMKRVSKDAASRELYEVLRAYYR